MRVIFLRSVFVLILSTFSHSSYAEQNVQTQVIELINQGRTNYQLGNIHKAISDYRNALMLLSSDPSVSEDEIFSTFNLYSESYSTGLMRIFGIPQDRDKDEKLLRAIAEYAVQKKNTQFAQMVHGLLLHFGEVKFGNPSKGILYSYLRGDPLEPTCTLENPLPPIASVNQLEKLAPCQQNRAFFNLVNPAITPEVKAYRKFEIDFFDQAVRPSL